MTPAGKPMGSPPGRSVENFRTFMDGAKKQLKEYTDLKAKADKGDAKARIDFFIAGLKMGDYDDLDEAKKHLATLKKPSKEQQAEIDGCFAGFEVQKIAEPLKSNRDRAKVKELQLSTGKQFAEMEKAGRIPSKKEDFGFFYSLILIHAEEEKNVALFEKSLNALKEKFGADINQNFVKAKESVLEKMKAEKGEEKK
jgi:hypothetical protein